MHGHDMQDEEIGNRAATAPACLEMTHESAFWMHCWVFIFDSVCQLYIVVTLAAYNGGPEELLATIFSLIAGSGIFGWGNKRTVVLALQSIHPSLVSETWFGVSLVLVLLPFVGPAVCLYALWFAGSSTRQNVGIPNMGSYCGEFEDSGDFIFMLVGVFAFRLQSIGIPIFAAVRSGSAGIAVVGALYALVDLSVDAWLFRFQALHEDPEEPKGVAADGAAGGELGDAGSGGAPRDAITATASTGEQQQQTVVPTGGVIEGAPTTSPLHAPTFAELGCGQEGRAAVLGRETGEEHHQRNPLDAIRETGEEHHQRNPLDAIRETGEEHHYRNPLDAIRAADQTALPSAAHPRDDHENITM